jgi:hypothetical protein
MKLGRIVVTDDVHVDGMRLILPPPTGLLFIPQTIYYYGEPQRKTEKL